MCASVNLQSCVTTLDTFTFDFKWTIKSVETFLDSKRNLSSLKFTPDLKVDGCKFEWQLHLEYVFSSNWSKYCLFAKVSLAPSALRRDTSGKNFFVIGALSFKKEVFDKLYANCNKQWVHFPNSNFFRQTYDCEVLKKEYVVDDTLEAYMKFKFYLVEQPKHTVLEASNSPVFDISKTLNDARLNNTFTDVTLVCDSSEFKAHRVVLASQSEFFKTRFEERWETEDNKVDMSDLTQQILEAIISYLYSGTCADLDNIAPDLLIAADKYQIPVLKTACEHSMLKTLCVDNAVEYLKFANSINADSLKQQIMKFLLSNHDVRQSKQWEELDNCDPVRIEMLEVWTEKTISINELSISDS